MASTDQASAPSLSPLDLLLISLWWGLLAGLGEGLVAPTYIWRDLMRAGVEVEPWLFLTAALLVVAITRRRSFRNDELMRATFVFSGLSVFACLSRSPWAPPLLITLLATVAAASVLGFVWFLGGSVLVKWQKRSLPVLLLAALWCLIGFPIKQSRHELHDLARLPAAASGSPNVLVVVVDTLRADHLSTYGYSRPTSPYLSQLAAQGTLFQNAIAPSSWTLPVHASLLTGLYPDQHHVDTDASLLGWDYRTLGEEFMARGYRTAAFSANTLLFCRRRGFGRGFIHFEDDFQNFGSSFAQAFYGDLIKHLLFRLQLKADLFGRRSARDINDHALRWMDSDRRPFFVFLNYLDVHDPYRPPEPYLHRYTTMKHPGSRASEHWDWFEHLTPQQRQGAMDAYDGAINYVDDQISDLMRQMQRRGMDRNTIIAIVSDHGESFGEHGLMTHGNALYWELIHVPLILWAPGRIPEGKKVDVPVSLTSLPATLLEAAGELPHPDFPQPSFARLWSGEPSQGAMPDPISQLAQLNWSPTFPDYYGAMSSVTTAHWHYIHGGKFGDQLFPCCADEPEELDLADTLIGRQLASGFRRELTADAAPPPSVLGDSAQDNHLRSTYGLRFAPAHLALADFDGNGDLDIMVTDRNRHQVVVLLGDGKGGFAPVAATGAILRSFISRRTAGAGVNLAQCRTAPGQPSCALALADNSVPSGSSAIPARGQLIDLDGDGHHDVLLGKAAGQNAAWMRADGRGRFYLTHSRGHGAIPPLTGTPIALVRGDIDGNGTEDLAFADQQHSSVIFLFAVHPRIFARAALPLTDSPTAIALADLNHNGRADLVIISAARKSVTVMLSL
ncbi:MAG TPA: sulfatase-like hydrolase/transferase [Terriglobales bacterium]|nr:sulfatase-like hydrolase/transferase [Terriglobales bacterium]